METLNLNKTYILKNLKIKASKQLRYLNTAKDIEFQFSETSPFEQPLAQVDDDCSDLSSHSIQGKIIGVQQIQNSKGCVICRKKVIPLPSDNSLGKCEDCELVQLLSLCASQWYMRIVVQENSSTPPKIHRLALFNQQVQELMSALSTQDGNVPESSLTVAILKADKCFAIIFDQNSHKVENMQVSM